MEEKKRILIVEDERAIVEILKFNLMREGYDTLEALDGELVIEPSTFSVTKNGEPVDLTQKEYDLLLHLLRERGKVFTREDLMQKVWNYDYFGDMRTVDVTVRRLREKIEADPGKPQYILTKRGAGYYFAP